MKIIRLVSLRIPTSPYEDEFANVPHKDFGGKKKKKSLIQKEVQLP